MVEHAEGTAGSTSTRHVLAWHVFYAVGMAVACLVAYWVALYAFGGGFPETSETIGAMWAAIAAAFVFRDSGAQAVTAGVARLRATSVSFVLCLIYLLVFPPTAVGIAVIIGAGTLVVSALHWRQDIFTTAITTIVVMVLAQLDPHNAWYQPVLRFLDTLLGIAVGIAAKWLTDGSLVRRANQ